YLECEPDEHRRPVCPVPEHARGLSLVELGLSVGLRGPLECEGVTTALDLCLRSAEELLEVRGIGKKRLQEVRERLAAAGLWLSGEEPPSSKAAKAEPAAAADGPLPSPRGGFRRWGGGRR